MGSVGYWVCLFLGWWLCLVFGLCVCGLVVRFGIWFVCSLVRGVRFGIGFVCLWVSKYVIMPFNSRDDVSVGLFY